MKSLLLTIAYGLKSQRVLIISIVALGALSFLLLDPFSNNNRIELWSKIDAILGVVTLGIALLVWSWQVRQDWEDTLPKRLNITYLHQSKPIMACENAYLISEGDIRNLAQQMGAQISGDQRLKISPILDMKPPVVELIPNQWAYVKRYHLTMHLTEVPEKVKNKRLENNNPDAVMTRIVSDNKVEDEIVSVYPG